MPGTSAVRDDGVVTVDSLDESAYEQHTRTHYRDPAVARRYARRQSLTRSPAEWLVGQLEKWQVRHGLRRLDLPTDARILDCPAGSGKLSQMLNKTSDFYCAADVSVAMLTLGQASAMVVADATQLPFRSGSFDATVCLRLLHRVAPPVFETTLSEAARVAGVGVVFSYAGTAQVPMLHRLVQRITGRTGQRLLPFSTSAVDALVHAQGSKVLVDRSISFGLTAERVAVAAVIGGAEWNRA